MAETKRTATRTHKCSWCGLPINVGDEYWNWPSYDPANGYAYKMHPECREAWEKQRAESEPKP